MSGSDERVEFLCELVDVPSPSTHERRASELLARKARELGMRAKVDGAGNAVALNNSASAEKVDLLLFSHIDTVPKFIPARREGRRIYGRGAVDAKASLCALLFAAASVDVPYNIMVAGVVEEETTSSKGIRHLLTYARPRMAILGEPSNSNGVTIAYKGRMLVEATTRGEMAHAGMKVETPIERTLEYYHHLRTEFPYKNPYDSVIMNLTYMRCGSRDALNVIPEELEFAIDIRFPPGMDAGGIIHKMREHAPRHITLNVKEKIDGVETDVNHPLARAFVRAIKKHSLAPRFVRKSGSSDMNITAAEGVPTVAYGPGDSRLDHTDHEFVETADYLKSIEILKDVLKEMKF
ncbi:MAG: M20/M25/M40 family metallo-hydrolase [Candidatus Micrarchaeota archaeon]